MEVSPSGVRGVWLCHDLETRCKRLMPLERESRENTTIILTDAQILLLDRHSPDFYCRHAESLAPGELLNQDTFYWGTLKGVGKVYVQVVVDTFCSLPFYDAIGVPVQAILTDNGREFCGKPQSLPYELLLAIEDIEHRNTKLRSPRTNGFVERMNQTLLDECFRVKGRENFYLTIQEIQRDLDAFMTYYNLERSHQEYRRGPHTSSGATSGPGPRRITEPQLLQQRFPS